MAQAAARAAVVRGEVSAGMRSSPSCVSSCWLPSASHPPVLNAQFRACHARGGTQRLRSQSRPTWHIRSSRSFCEAAHTRANAGEQLPAPKVRGGAARLLSALPLAAATLGASLAVLISPGVAFASARDLAALAAAAVPYDEVFGNGKPTMIEFYADWCEACQLAAPEALGVEKDYRERVNFVMINIDNPKWAAELDEFGVDAIPHLSFLDASGDEVGFLAGRYSGAALRGNLDALLGGAGAQGLPSKGLVGEYSEAQGRAVAQAQPRTHGL